MTVKTRLALLGFATTILATLIATLSKCSDTGQKPINISVGLQTATPSIPDIRTTPTPVTTADYSATIDQIDSSSPRQASSPSTPGPSLSTSTPRPTLSAMTVIVLPMRNVSPEPKVGERYLEYGKDRVRAKLVSLGLTNVADREDFGAIESELKYLTETPNSSQHSVLNSAIEQASKYGARWLIIPVLSVDVARVKRDAYSGRADIATVTARVTLYVVDILSSTYKGVAEFEQRSEPEYALTDGIAVKGETIRKTVDSACSASVSEIAKKYFRKK